MARRPQSQGVSGVIEVAKSIKVEEQHMKRTTREKDRCVRNAGSNSLLSETEYCSDLKYCANHLRKTAQVLERHEPGAEHDEIATTRANLRAVAVRLGRYVRQTAGELEARAAIHCALGEAITRLEGLGYSSGCNEWREIWRATEAK